MQAEPNFLSEGARVRKTWLSALTRFFSAAWHGLSTEQSRPVAFDSCFCFRGRLLDVGSL